jgi:RNA:NAD 2'-phosphotransferase (TPT1/KptA family)
MSPRQNRINGKQFLPKILGTNELGHIDNLFSQLTTARVIRDDELVNGISQAILRLLRHGDSASGVVFDQFGLVAEEQFKTWIGRQFPDIPAERFQACLASQIDELLAAEKIEFRCGRIRALYGHSIRRVLVGEMK